MSSISAPLVVEAVEGALRGVRGDGFSQAAGLGVEVAAGCCERGVPEEVSELDDVGAVGDRDRDAARVLEDLRSLWAPRTSYARKRLRRCTEATPHRWHLRKPLG